MVLELVCCPDCGSEDVVKNGKSNEGKQRYLCRDQDCRRRSFVRDYTYWGYLPSIKQQITDMAANGSGIRDTARVLKINPTTVIEKLTLVCHSRQKKNRNQGESGLEKLER